MPSLSLFLSYNSVDRSAVVAVQTLLQARGITTFLDRDRLTPGLPWPMALEEGLRSVRGVAVFIGQDLGGWQKREMWFALDRQVREEKEGRPFPVIPVLLAGADLTTSFLFLNTWIDLRNGLDGAATIESLDGFERAIRATGSAAATEYVSTVRPYRGLEAFREEDAAFFAGRAAFAKQLFDFTLGKDLVAVVGPSGSGKSSVVQAGLIPRLRSERPPSTTWDAVSFTPGSAPFQRLASALMSLLEPDVSEIDRLREAQKLGDGFASGEVKLESVIDRVIEKSNGTGRLLLIADQFEEVFTLTPELDRRPFATALLRALGKARFTLLITLRADFYSQIITLDRDLSDRLAPAQLNLGALTHEELRESIVAPGKLVGLEFEPGLIDRILRDVGNEPGNLPLLEFALTGLWSKRQGRTLTNSAYDEIGGVTGALTQRAEAEFAKFTAEEQAAARRLFSRLVRVATLEEGSEDTRQRIELRATDDLSEKVARALARPEVRLLVMSGEMESQTVEVAHEALIRNWERLRLWLNEDREFLLWRQRTQILMTQYNEHGGDAGDLLRGASLSEAERWLATRPQDIPDVQAQYIKESAAARQRELEAEEQRRHAELQNAERLREAAEARAKEQAQHAKRSRRFSLALGVLLLLALGTAGLAFWEQAMALARQLVATSVSVQDADPELSVLIAAQAIAVTWPVRHAALPEAEEQLHNAIFASHVGLTLTGHTADVISVTWSPDGTRLATGSGDHSARVWDAATGKELLTLTGHTADVISVAWSPDGTRLATGSGDHTARVWDAATGEELLTLTGHTADVISVAWSPDDKRVATASDDKTAKVWDAATGKELLTLTGHSDYVESVAWSPDGKRVATASEDKTAKVWDANTGNELLTLTGHSNPIVSIAWSSDGQRVATASEDKTAKVWDPNTGNELLTLTGHSGSVVSIAWNPDGKRLATGSGDDTAKVWDAATGNELLTLTGHSNPVLSVAWNPDGKRLATGSGDHTARVWDAATGNELLTLTGHSNSVDSVAWSPDGKRLATASEDKTAKVWDAATGKELLTLTGHSNSVDSVAWSPDGKRLATASGDHTARVWDVATGEELLTLTGHSGSVDSVAWSPDGKRLATGSRDGTAKVRDAATGKELLTLSGHSGWVDSVAWSPDGKRLATGSYDKTAKVWDPNTGKELLTLTGDSNIVSSVNIVTSVAWSPDGKRLATGSLDKKAKVWDATTGKELLILSGHSNIVTSVTWSPDGNRLATGSLDKKAKVWDAATGKELLTLNGHSGYVESVAWSLDGKRLATGGADRTVQVYVMDIPDLMNLARERVTAHPSTENCKKYLHSECPPFPKLGWW